MRYEFKNRVCSRSRVTPGLTIMPRPNTTSSVSKSSMHEPTSLRNPEIWSGSAKQHSRINDFCCSSKRESKRKAFHDEEHYPEHSSKSLEQCKSCGLSDPLQISGFLGGGRFVYARFRGAGGGVRLRHCCQPGSNPRSGTYSIFKSIPQRRKKWEQKLQWLRHRSGSIASALEIPTLQWGTSWALLRLPLIS